MVLNQVFQGAKPFLVHGKRRGVMNLFIYIFCGQRPLKTSYSQYNVSFLQTKDLKTEFWTDRVVYALCVMRYALIET